APIDMDITNKLLSYSENIQSIPKAFYGENSVEMEVPFIQYALKDARLVLIALCDVKQQNCRLLVEALYSVLREEKNFVIVASTDMSHKLPYDAANAVDAGTIEVIKSFDPEKFYRKSLEDKQGDRMCGFGAVYTVMEVCKKLGADEVKILKYANSGDTIGGKYSVVGYLSAAFVKTGKEGGGE
ncbi:MAG: AmmeMemoRadiSam system protein B, partial [Candidatus Omnitrophota bacterium]